MLSGATRKATGWWSATAICPRASCSPAPISWRFGSRAFATTRLGRTRRVRFSSSILPPYLRRSKSIEELIPWLYLKGVSTGDFSVALQALLGEDAKGLSANVLNKMPKSVQPRAKADLHETWMAQTRRQACQAFDAFLERCGPKYPAACECLKKDRQVLPAFYHFPAEHWIHLRTTNPIESTFATIRLRHGKTKGSGTRRASLAMTFKLAQCAQKRWRWLNGHRQIAYLLQGDKFVPGIRQTAA